MAEMTMNKRKLNRLIAHAGEARRGVQAHGEIARRKAGMILAQSHGAAPHAFIATYMGKGDPDKFKGLTDYYIVLNDTRGTKSAMTIEFGRKGGNEDKNGRIVTASRAVAPLRRSVGLR